MNLDKNARPATLDNFDPFAEADKAVAQDAKRSFVGRFFYSLKCRFHLWVWGIQLKIDAFKNRNKPRSLTITLNGQKKE